MNPTVILVRHGTTPLNLEKRLRAWSDVGLDYAATRDDLERTASQLALLSTRDPLISSDLRRARQSAEIIANILYAEIDEQFDARPWDAGELSQMKIEDIAPRMNYFVAHPTEKVPGGERFQTFLDRWRGLFEREIARAIRAPEEARIIVTHSRNIEAARYFVTGDKSTLVTANSVPPGNATSWQVRSGKLVETAVGGPSTVGEELNQNADT